MGKVEHSATLHVYGAPYVRPMANVAAVAGKRLVLNCPVSGYPIESIWWENKGKYFKNIKKIKCVLIKFE